MKKEMRIVVLKNDKRKCHVFMSRHDSVCHNMTEGALLSVLHLTRLVVTHCPQRFIRQAIMYNVAMGLGSSGPDDMQHSEWL